MIIRIILVLCLFFSEPGMAQVSSTAPNAGVHRETSSSILRKSAEEASPAPEVIAQSSVRQGVDEAAQGLQIIIVEGGKQINNIKSRTAREVLIQVQDENRRPVGSATVTVLLPSQGPSGVFANGQTTYIGTTGPDGRLKFSMRPNGVAGDFQARLAASFGGRSATAVLAQTNIMAAAAIGGLSTAAIVAIVAGAAAAGVAVAAAGGSGGSGGRQTVSQPPSIGIGIGAGLVVIGPPQ